MNVAEFRRRVEEVAQGRHVVSLQGEGEPTVHPRFWEFVRELTDCSHTPYTITNGSLIDPELAHRYFPRLGFSVDTLDTVEADRIGRLKLPEALKRLDALLALMGPQRIIVHTVDYGQELEPLKAFIATRDLRHIIQPLQRKADYARRYPDLVSASPSPETISGPCRYLTSNQMRYFNIDGTEFPCCYIKDPAGYQGIDDLRQRMSKGMVPQVCTGCAEIPKMR